MMSHLLYFINYHQSITQIMKQAHPFQTHKQLFQKIPKSQRAEWNQQMLNTPQLKGEYKIYKEQYPQAAVWEYQKYKVHYAYYKNGDNPRAVLFYFHGMNAHGGSSAYFTMKIARKLNLDVYCQDFLNFGRSQGPFRGFIQSFDDMINQAQGFVDYIMQNYAKETKVYISGLSFGGSICFELCLRNPARYSGVIFLSPALRQNYESQPFMKKVGKVFGYLFPKGKLVSQTFNSQSRYDQTDRIMQDQFIYKDKVVPGSVKVVLQTMEELQKKYEKFSHPFILIQSGIDKLVDPFLALDLEEQCSSKDKTVIYCKDMWHAVFGEEQIVDIVPIVTDWLGERLDK